MECEVVASIQNNRENLFQGITDLENRAEEIGQLAFSMLLGQLNMMHLTEFKFVQNCLRGIFEEITV